MRPSVVLALGLGLAMAGAVGPADLSAQDVEMRGRIHGVQPPPGYYDVLARYPDAYRFQGVWKEKARRVRERRQALMRAGDFATLNSHFRDGRASRSVARSTGVAVTGTFRIPVLIGVFSDSTHAILPDSAALDSVLFNTALPPYSVSTYYDEISDSLVTVTGDIIGWFAVDSTAGWYEGSNNGLDPGTDHTGDFIEELLDAADPGTDFSVYDNDGNGTVDLVTVLHPLVDGACGSSHIWSHRWVYSAWKGSAYSTGDGVTANDYMIQPAVGGSGGCDGGAIMPIGTFSHELGHGMADLPDLYDTSGASEGIGEWGLMGSGNWRIQTSPAHMMAWSKDDVGWITVVPLSDPGGVGAHLLNPVVSSDTAYRIEVAGTTEYFMLENRHALGSDAHLHGEGLLIWHIAPDLIAARRNSNTVNAVVPHGVDLEQADGLDDLGNGLDRGDGGDPYPGSTANTIFGPTSVPNSELTDGSSSGVSVDSITINGDESIAFRLNFNLVSELVTTSVGAGTEVIVDGDTAAAPYAAEWAYPSVHTIAVDSIQGDTLTRYVFQSWSDGGAREHSVVADATPDTFTANLATEFRLRATSDLSGSVEASVALDGSGVAWLSPATGVQLVGVPDPGFLFVHWTGDTTAITDTLDLTMDMPYTVRARFGLPVAIETDTLTDGVMGANYVDTLSASGGADGHTWTLIDGDGLPTGLTLHESSGAITGVAEEDGVFNLVLEAVSGALSAEDTVVLTVTQPTLVLDDVVNHLISPVSPLSTDEERFLDLIGNNNGGYDIGDLRAYLQETGVIADVAPAHLLEAEEEAESRQRGKVRKEGGR